MTHRDRLLDAAARHGQSAARFALLSIHWSHRDRPGLSTLFGQLAAEHRSLGVRYWNEANAVVPKARQTLLPILDVPPAMIAAADASSPSNLHRAPENAVPFCDLIDRAIPSLRPGAALNPAPTTRSASDEEEGAGEGARDLYVLVTRKVSPVSRKIGGPA